MARYAYMMLDRQESDVSRQALLLDAIGGFDRIFVDQLQTTGRQGTREQRNRLMDLLQPGDVVFTAAADRFCDHTRDFLLTADHILQAGAELVLLQENLDSRSPAGRQSLRILMVFEELDYAWQSQQKKAGIQAARRQGRRIGRPPVAVPPDFRKICTAWTEGKISGQEAARRSGLHNTSFYKKAAELGFKAPAKSRRP